MRTSLSTAMIALCFCVLCGPAMAQYSASDASMNTDIQSAGRRALSQHALESHRNTGRATGQGPNVNLNIVFPGDQTGLENIEAVTLVPHGSGAHDCEAIAQHSSEETLYAVFIPSKGVAPNHSYDVVVSDARGDKYLVGQVHVGRGGRQDFTLRAPLLTPDSPLYSGPTPEQSFVEPQREPVASPELKEEFKREAAREPWISGMKVLTISHAMLVALGEADVDLHAVAVYAVEPGSPAEQAGIMKGDVIARINGHRCRTAEEFAFYAFRGEVSDGLDLEMYSQRVERAISLHVVGDVRWDPSATEPGYVPPGESRYVPPAVGPGFVPPANDISIAAPQEPPTQPAEPAPPVQRSDVKPLPDGSSDFKAPTTGPGYRPPGG